MAFMREWLFVLTAHELYSPCPKVNACIIPDIGIFFIKSMYPHVRGHGGYRLIPDID